MDRVTKTWQIIDASGHKVGSFQGDYDEIRIYAAGMGGSWTPDPENDLLVQDSAQGFDWNEIRAGRLVWTDAGTMVNRVLQVFLIEVSFVKSPENYVHRGGVVSAAKKPIQQPAGVDNTGKTGAAQRRASNEKIRAYSMRKAREVLSRGAYDAKLWIVWTPLRHRVGRFIAKSLVQLSGDDDFERLYANRWSQGPIDAVRRRYSWEDADLRSGLSEESYREHYLRITGLVSETRLAEIETARRIADPERVSSEVSGEGSDPCTFSDQDEDMI